MTNEVEAESSRHGPDYELVDFIWHHTQIC